MIFDASTLELPLRIKADLCIVGSGAGGAAAAAVAAEAGLSVVVLEAGAFIPPVQMNQREADMFPELLYANGSQTTVDRSCTIVQGRALGGSTIHNINLCKRIPDPILDAWRRDGTLKHLPAETWNALYEEVEALIRVSPIPEARRNRHNQLLEEGARKLGWRGGGLSHNRTGCIGSGFCEVGCAYDAKNNAVRIFVPRAVDAGAQILTHCRAVELLHEDGRMRGVEAAALDPQTREPVGTVTIEAPRVCVSASATGTPALLIRSEIPDPSGRVGNHLRLHPALVAAGRFDEPVRAWTGIPQSYECTEFLDFEAAHPPEGADAAALENARNPGNRTWIIPAFAHPVATATMLPGWGKAHRELMSDYDHMAVFTAMIHDRSTGRVRPSGELGVDIQWWPNEADRRELCFGLARAAELLFAAGAREVIIPTRPVRILKPSDSLAWIEELELEPGLIQITAVHPMGTVPMDDDPARAAVNSRGEHHHVEGLWVADGSLFPSSIGVPPQMSIYAMGLHVGRAIAQDFNG
jgi:choline dehydrogenase-like flavoprotein